MDRKDTGKSGLIELAAKCFNPIVRNALLTAASGGDRREAERIVASHTRRASRKWSQAVKRQSEATWNAVAVRRTGGQVDTRTLETLDAETGEAQEEYSNARNALRAIRMTGTGKDTTGGAERL